MLRDKMSVSARTISKFGKNCGRLSGGVASFVLVILLLAGGAQLAVAGTPDPSVSDWPMENRDAFHSSTTPNTLGERIDPNAVWTRDAKAQGSQIIGNGKI